MIHQSTATAPLLEIARLGIYARDGQAVLAARRLRAAMKRTGMELRLLSCESQDDGDDFLAPEDWNPDVVLALGGDGTVLHALGRYPQIPLLAVNFGSIGFLTAGDEDDLSQMIFRLMEGDYIIEERTILTTEIHGQRNDAINEVVVKATTKMVSIEVSIDGTYIHTIRGDGVIVGTPTGSTSYLMSTGASIVMPTVDALVLSGINEYRFSSRSLILHGDSVVDLRLADETRDPDVFATHDGRDRVNLEIGDVVRVRRGDRHARLIYFDRHTFFRNLKERLDW